MLVAGHRKNMNTPGLLMPPKWFRWVPVWSTAIYFKQPVWQWIALVILPLFALLVVWIPFRCWSRKAVALFPGVRFSGWIVVILIAVATVMLLRYVLDVRFAIWVLRFGVGPR
jgi:hypothetical protein